MCSETVIKMWEADSGKLVYQITDSHGSGVEVTAIGMDKSGYRLATGAIDGTAPLLFDHVGGQGLLKKFAMSETVVFVSLSSHHPRHQ